MNICILGATGNSGERLVAEALRRGHSVTAVAREPRDLAMRFPDARVKQVDFSKLAPLIEVMAGHDAVVNAAGYVGTGTSFVTLVSDIIAAAREALGAGGRFWMFAGAALLDVPGTDRKTLSLPGVPKVYDPHLANYEAVRKSGLAWSVLCPGPMIESPSGSAHDGLVVSTEHWPVERPSATRYLPWIATSLAFKNAIGRMTIYYEDAAKVILDGIEDAALVQKRVGVALPDGETLHKDDAYAKIYDGSSEG